MKTRTAPRAELQSTVYVTGDGQTFSQQTPGAARIQTYDDGNGGTFDSIAPPSGWNPISATDQELATYGFPPRPEDPSALAAWNALYSNFKGFYDTVPCINVGVYNGIIGDSPTSNWSGESVSGPHTTYDEVTAEIDQPSMQQCTGGVSDQSEWVGVSNEAANPANLRLAQNGTATQSPSDSHFALWWEQISPTKADPEHVVGWISRSDAPVVALTMQHSDSTHNTYDWYNVTKGYAWEPKREVGNNSYSGLNAEFQVERPATSPRSQTYSRLEHFSDVTFADELVFWSGDGSQQYPPGVDHPGSASEETYTRTMTTPEHGLAKVTDYDIDSFTDHWLKCS